MTANLSLSYTKPSKVLSQVSQVVLVRKTMLSTCQLCLQVYVIPCDAVVHPGGDAPSHGEEQPLLPRQVQTVQGLDSLLIIWQESCPRKAYRVVILTRVGMLLSLYTSLEHEAHLDSTTATVSGHGAPEQPVGHGARGGPGPRPHAVHLLAGGALQEWRGRVSHESRKAGRVERMLAVHQGQYRGQGGAGVAGAVGQVQQADRTLWWITLLECGGHPGGRVLS